MSNPDRPEYERYFRKVWIPDESYFQTLARRFSSRIESHSLTLSRFDCQGRPDVFYDNHLHLLRRSNCFVARKIWPHADLLYDAFLHGSEGARGRQEPDPVKVDQVFARAAERRVQGRSGLYMQSRFPGADIENTGTAAPYSVFQGFAELFEDFEAWLAKATGARVHGHLFAPDRAHFAQDRSEMNGALSDNAVLRKYNPDAFLTILLWNTRGERQCFQFGPGDNQAINWRIAKDPNAQVSVIA